MIFPTSIDMKDPSIKVQGNLNGSKIKEVFDYVYMKGGSMRGLRARSLREFGLMKTKLVRRIINRKLIIEQAIKNNQMWNLRFHNANKRKQILPVFRCFCAENKGMKTISEEFNFCEKCDVFYARTAAPVFKYL